MAASDHRQDEGASFSADWLALREPVDHACVAPSPLAAVVSWLSRQAVTDEVSGEPLDIVDLGSGTGSHCRLLLQVFGWRVGRALRWTLAERDPELLATACDLLVEMHSPSEQASVELQPLAVDIDAGFASLPIDDSALVTGSALLDLVSEPWLRRLVARAAQAHTAVYFRLSVSGWIRLTPGHEADAAVVEAFNAHQARDKGFGAALGPQAGPLLAALLHETGFEVTCASSNWVLTANDAALAGPLLDGYADVAVAQGLDPARVAAWRAARELSLRAGELRIEVGHWDVAGIPAEDPELPASA